MDEKSTYVEKPTSYDKCYKSSSQSCALKEHISTQIGEKPYSGEKPFSCDECDKYCLHKDVLKKHIETKYGLLLLPSFFFLLYFELWQQFPQLSLL